MSDSNLKDTINGCINYVDEDEGVHCYFPINGKELEFLLPIELFGELEGDMSYGRCIALTVKEDGIPIITRREPDPKVVAESLKRVEEILKEFE